MERICGIYKITSPTNKIYIGQSVNIKHRFQRYKSMDCKLQSKLYRSLLKYGCDKHKFEIIEQCDQSELNKKEVYYIELYQSFNSKFGLNLESGGNVKKVSDETKILWSKQRKGHPNYMLKQADSMKQKTSERMKGNKYNLGRKLSEETKEKISQSNKGRKITEEHKLILSNFHKGRKNSEETRKRISESHKGIPLSQETKDKMKLSHRCNINKDWKISDETRKKLSDSKKGKNNHNYGKIPWNKGLKYHLKRKNS